MAVTALLYGSFPAKLANKEIDWDTDVIKVMLLTDAYVPNQDAHDYLDDVVANEVVGTGYVAGGMTLANKTAGYTAGTNVTKFDADDVTWNPSSLTARYAAIYDSSPGTNATRPLIALVDFGANFTSTNGPFTISWDAAGIFTATVT